jgi:hypothetical protein
VTFFQHGHFDAARGEVEGETCAVNPAADEEKIEGVHGGLQIQG